MAERRRRQEQFNVQLLPLCLTNESVRRSIFPCDRYSSCVFVTRSHFNLTFTELLTSNLLSWVLPLVGPISRPYFVCTDFPCTIDILRSRSDNPLWKFLVWSTRTAACSRYRVQKDFKGLGGSFPPEQRPCGFFHPPSRSWLFPFLGYRSKCSPELLT